MIAFIRLLERQSTFQKLIDVISNQDKCSTSCSCMKTLRVIITCGLDSKHQINTPVVSKEVDGNFTNYKLLNGEKLVVVSESLVERTKIRFGVISPQYFYTGDHSVTKVEFIES